MELNGYRAEIDTVDRELIRLLERRFDIAAGIAQYKLAHDLPVTDAPREADKLRAVRAMCRPETADHIAGIFEAVMAGSRAYQMERMEGTNG